ncbi:MAG: hypothetical protein IJV05_02425 [Muribaculaceae bacterium]|nr:hypothetical protein [Muribaculaceae bacterium]
MEDNINNFNEIELDDLRRQINDLKQKVDQQGRLNEDLVKKAIQGKMRGLHHSLLIYCLVVGLFVPFMIWDFIESGFSWAFIIFTILIFACSFIAEYFINQMKISNMGEDLVETARKLLQMKKNRKTQLAVGFCAIAIWIPWYIYEIYKNIVSQVAPESVTFFLTCVIIGMVIGGAIGLAIGLTFYRRLQRTNDEMIDQINELTREQ